MLLLCGPNCCRTATCFKGDGDLKRFPMDGWRSSRKEEGGELTEIAWKAANGKKFAHFYAGQWEWWRPTAG